MGVCAYCGENRPSTKEHIWPKALIAKYEELHAFNPRKGNFFRGEPVVRDVCEMCNNERLSPLDDYLSQIFDRFFATIVKPGQPATFEYDYHRLARALLKISYNSSRSVDGPRARQLLRQYSSYILNGGYSPRFALRIQVVTSASAIDLTNNVESVIEPTALKVGTLAYDGPLANRFLVRLVAFNSYWFYLLLPFKQEPDHKWRDFVAGLTSWRTPVGISISPTSSAIIVPVNKTTYMHRELLGSLLDASST